MELENHGLNPENIYKFRLRSGAFFMEKIYKNDELLELTNGSYLIHDSSVTRFDIYIQDYHLCIDVYFDS